MDGKRICRDDYAPEDNVQLLFAPEKAVPGITGVC